MAKHDGPSYMRIDKSCAGFKASANDDVQIGKAREILRGKDVCFIGIGGILSECVKAVEVLQKQNISAGVVEMATIKPIDAAAILAVAGRSSLIVTVEEHSVIGGLGGAVAEIMADNGCGVPLLRIGLQDTYSSVVGSQDYLRSYYEMDSPAIVERVSTALEAIKC